MNCQNCGAMCAACVCAEGTQRHYQKMHQQQTFGLDGQQRHYQRMQQDQRKLSLVQQQQSHCPTCRRANDRLEISNQSPIFEFEGFIIRPFDGWHVWFEHPDGSGTQLRKTILLGWLVRLFKEHM